MTKYQVSVFLSLLTLATLLLGGCAGPSLTRAPSVDEERLAQADRLRADGVYYVAAEIYLDLADETTEPLRSDLRLSAIESLLASGDAIRAGELLANLPATLTSSQQNRVRLADAEVALLEFQPVVTLELLALPLDTPGTEENLRYHQLRAQAFGLTGNHVAAVQERIRIDRLVPPGTERQKNQLALWQDLLQASDDNLSDAEVTTASADLRGWISLVRLVRAGQRDPEALAQSLGDWELRNPAHPAVAGGIVRDLQAGIGRLGDYPEQIGVLLPFTGPWSRAAAAVRDGMLAAYYSSPDFSRRPVLRFYDTGTDPRLSLAKYDEALADGMQFVIGPLRKESVAELETAPSLRTPVLALNTDSSSGAAPANLYHFSLAPEDEAGQVAEKARNRGYRRALVIAPSGSWGERIVASFAARWASLDGEVAEVQYFGDDQKQLSATVSKLLNIDDSKRRYRSLARTLGKKLEFEPRRRQDVDFVFIVASPRQARLIRPLLQFHRASDLPVLATSHVYNGYGDTRSDRDMDGILFCDMPWVLDTRPTVQSIRQTLDEAMPDRTRRYTRFYAMGIDAYNLIPYLPEMGRGTLIWYSGMTGNLRLDSKRNIHRTLLWAQFHDGAPRLISTPPSPVPPAGGRTFDSQEETRTELRREANHEEARTPYRYGTGG